MAVCRVEMSVYTSLFYVRHTLSRACLLRSLIENMPFFPEHSIPVAFAENNSTAGLWPSLFFKCLLQSWEHVPSSAQPERGRERSQREEGKEGESGGDSWVLVYSIFIQLQY